MIPYALDSFEPSVTAVTVLLATLHNYDGQIIASEEEGPTHPTAPLKTPWINLIAIASGNEVQVPKRAHVIALPVSAMISTARFPCLAATVAHNSEVKN